MPKKENKISRLVTNLIAIPAGAAVIFLPVLNGLLVALAVMFAQLMTMFEIALMAEKRGVKFHLWVASAFSTLTSVNFYLYGLGVFPLGVFAAAELGLIGLFAVVVMAIDSYGGEFDHALENMGVAFFAAIYVGVMPAFMILLKATDLSGWTLSMVLFLCWLTDGGGYFIGSWLGKSRLPKLSSPNKTVEGYLGSLTFGLVTGLLLFFAQNLLKLSTSLSLGQFLLLAFVMVVTSDIGDLGESAIKRWAGVKDSGTMLPGHGGVFDLFDSVYVSLPIFYLLLKVFGY